MMNKYFALWVLNLIDEDGKNTLVMPLLENDICYSFFEFDGNIERYFCPDIAAIVEQEKKKIIKKLSSNNVICFYNPNTGKHQECEISNNTKIEVSLFEIIKMAERETVFEFGFTIYDGDKVTYIPPQKNSVECCVTYDVKTAIYDGKYFIEESDIAKCHKKFEENFKKERILTYFDANDGIYKDVSVSKDATIKIDFWRWEVA